MKKLTIIILILLSENALSQTNQINNYGLKIPSQEYLDSLPKQEFIPGRPQSIGKFKDLSNWLPIPGNQGRQGSCVAWTLGYGLKTFQERVEEKNTSLIFSPAFVFNSLKGLSGGCDEGIYFSDAFEFIKDNGVSEWQDMPYNDQDCNTNPSFSAKQNAKKYNIEDWKTIYASENTPIPDIYSIKYEIFRGNPVGIAVWLDSKIADFMDDETSGKKKFVWRNPLNDTSKLHYYHALLCVGYDDDRKEFKVLNSYGPNSGNSGYIYISYEAFAKVVYEAYYAIDSDNSGKYVVATRPKTNKTEFGLMDTVPNFWLKKGYFMQITDDIKISCAYLNKSNDSVIIRLFDTSGSENKLIGSYGLNSGDEYKITYNNKVYNLKLDKISSAGLNIFKSAAFIEFSSN